MNLPVAQPVFKMNDPSKHHLCSTCDLKGVEI